MNPRKNVMMLLALAACGRPPEKTPQVTAEQKATLAVKDFIATQVDDLHAAAQEMQAAAPAPDADGWNATQDAEAVEKMRAAWKKARVAYERVEGAIAVLFDDLDEVVDQRYDFFLTGDVKDDNLFDDKGVTGMHGVERILFSDVIPAYVVKFEKENVLRYTPAAFPANFAEADDFKNKLLQRLVDDTETMHTRFAPLALDAAAAYRGVIGSLEEQREKIHNAGSGAEESRYAQFTLADMRANLEGAERTYAAFREWILLQADGAHYDAHISEGLKNLRAYYDGVAGDAIPPAPAGWSEGAPDAQASDFGKLFYFVNAQVSPERSDSLVTMMLKTADLLGIPELP